VYTSLTEVSDSVIVSMWRSLSCKGGVLRTIVRDASGVKIDHEELSAGGSVPRFIMMI
jgi:hypothetical protein